MPINFAGINQQLNSGGGVVGAVGAQFGIPSCALNFATDLLNALPSPFLKNINSSIADGRRKAQEIMANVTRKLFLDSGIVEYDSRTGRLKFTNNVSDADASNSLLDDVNNLAGLGEVLGFASEVMNIVEGIQQQIEDIKACLSQLKNMGSYKRGGRRGASAIYASNIHRVENAKLFINKCDLIIGSIDSILDCRLNNPTLCPEPVMNGGFIFPHGEFSGMSVSSIFNGPGFVFSSASGVASIAKEIFYITTTLNPPQSKSGEFILHEKGIYYNSVSGGIDVPTYLPDLVLPDVLQNEYKWLLQHNPNAGGKGEVLSIEDFNLFANTILDINAESAIQESSEILPYYLADSLLQNIENQRNKHVGSIRAYITELIATPLAEDSAIVTNEKRNLISVISNYNTKIKRRKKQIQLAVVFGRVDTPNGVTRNYNPGEIPINDLSFMDLSPISLDHSNQRSLMFKSGDVSGVVLPSVAVFTNPKSGKAKYLLNHLTVPYVGVGDIITSATNSLHIQSLTDSITTDGLFAIYNFLDTDLVAPDSYKYLVTNSVGNDASFNAAQMVSLGTSSIYPSGVGIPYFTGITKLFSESNSKASFYSATDKQKYNAPSLPGNYVRLPNTDDFQSLLYRGSGFAIDFWCYVPTLTTSSAWGVDAGQTPYPVSSLHRLVLGNENIGGTSVVGDINEVYYNNSQDFVRGLMMGFTIDRRITKGQVASNSLADNPIDGDLKFHFSPTVSVNTSAVAFINGRIKSSDCVNGVVSSGFRTLGLASNVSATTNSGFKMSNVSSSFQHIAITGDNELSGGAGGVSLYINGELLTTSSYTDVFGDRGPPQIPSTQLVGSWKYTTVYDDILNEVGYSYITSSVGWSDFWKWDGPHTEIFTPWILGGGYTDGLMTKQFGIAETERTGMNFMGEYGGVKSGLNGYLGSVKFYRRALSIDEVKKNFDAQKGFFTNIKVP